MEASCGVRQPEQFSPDAIDIVVPGRCRRVVRESDPAIHHGEASWNVASVEGALRRAVNLADNAVRIGVGDVDLKPGAGRWKSEWRARRARRSLLNYKLHLPAAEFCVHAIVRAS